MDNEGKVTNCQKSYVVAKSSPNIQFPVSASGSETHWPCTQDMPDAHGVLSAAPIPTLILNYILFIEHGF